MAKLFTLQAQGDFSFVPGQYTAFKVNGAIRTYSICSLPGELPRFQFCVRQVPGGLGTGFLNANVGKEIELAAPAGDFIIKGTPAVVLVIASGVGIAPARPMLKDYLARNTEAAVELVYILKDGEYLFREEWKEMEEKYKNFGIKFEGVNKLIAAEVYLVGSPQFVGQTLNQLEQLGYNRRSIHTDIWE